MVATTSEEFDVRYAKASVPLAKSVQLVRDAAEAWLLLPQLRFLIGAYSRYSQKHFREMDLSRLTESEVRKTLLKLADIQSKTDLVRSVVEEITEASTLARFILSGTLPQLDQTSELLDEQIETLVFSLDKEIRGMLEKALRELPEEVAS